MSSVAKALHPESLSVADAIQTTTLKTFRAIILHQKADVVIATTMTIIRLAPPIQIPVVGIATTTTMTTLLPVQAAPPPQVMPPDAGPPHAIVATATQGMREVHPEEETLMVTNTTTASPVAGERRRRAG